MITIQKGTARIQNGTFKIIHSIDIEQYRILTLQIESILDTNITDNHPLRPFIKQQIIDIGGLLRRLSSSRAKRSIDFIGSAWKWIAGSPDSHDFQILEQKIDNILANNNRQLIINELTTKRIMELSNITNEITKAKREGWNNELANSLERKLMLIEKELENIEYAIQWAKANIVNSFILSKTEIENVNNILKNYNIPVYSIDELLSFGSVKIVTNNKVFLYILSIPITRNDICKVYLAKAIKKGNLIDKIEYNKILECNNELFAINTDCKNHYELTICNRDNLIELNDKYCITSLFKNRIGNCTQINNEHIPTVEEIGSDLLLLNQYEGTLSVNNEDTHLNGTYLVKYYNNTIQVNGREYYSKEISGNKPLPAVLQPKIKGDRVEEIISLERLSKLNIKNINRLEYLEAKSKILIGSSGLAVTIIIIIAIWRLRKGISKTNLKINQDKEDVTIENDEKNPNKDEPETTATNLETKKKSSSIYNLYPL